MNFERFNNVMMWSAIVIAGTVVAVAQADDCQCGDANDDSIRDEVCASGPCDAACTPALNEFGDVGGRFGACEPDGVLDNNDLFHVNNCVQNVSPDRTSAYACEQMMVDVGSLHSCKLDGVCDINDIMLIESALRGTARCDCRGETTPPSKPWQRYANLIVVPNVDSIQAGQFVSVDVFLDDTPQDDFKAYQIPLVVAGGTNGQLKPAGIEIADSPDFVFADTQFTEAHNLNEQKLVTICEDGIETGDRLYLGTAKFKAAADAEGTFLIQVDMDRASLHAAALDTRIDIGTDRAAVVKVSRRADSKTRPQNNTINFGARR